jgi:hypothetical protein
MLGSWGMPCEQRQATATRWACRSALYPEDTHALSSETGDRDVSVLEEEGITLSRLPASLGHIATYTVSTCSHAASTKERRSGSIVHRQCLGAGRLSSGPEVSE